MKNTKCVCEGNWRELVAETEDLIGKKFVFKYNDNKEFTFFGLVWSDDDFYYGMWSKESGLVLSSCVGNLDTNGFTLVEEPPVEYDIRDGINLDIE